LLAQLSNIANAGIDHSAHSAAQLDVLCQPKPAPGIRQISRKKTL